MMYCLSVSIPFPILQNPSRLIFRTVYTYVVPVSLTLLEHRPLELECSLPRTRLAGVLILRKRKLASVVIPGTQKVDGLDGGRGAEVE